MRLLRYEWSKLVRLPALWGVLALCLVFNCLLIGSGDRWRWEWNEAATMTDRLGQRVDARFLNELRQRPQSEYRDYLLSAGEGMTDIYEDYDLKALSSFYNGYVKSSPTAATLMERKYNRLAERVVHLSETGAAMDWYGGPMTHYVHQFLYGTLMRAVLTEGIVLAGNQKNLASRPADGHCSAGADLLLHVPQLLYPTLLQRPRGQVRV